MKVYQIISDKNVVAEGTQLSEQQVIARLESKFSIGTILSMLRTHQAHAEPVVAPVAPPPATGAEESPDPMTLAVPSLGLDEYVAEALEAAGVYTVGDVLDYVAQHESLTPIKGIGKSGEAKVLEAVRKLMPVDR